MAVDSRQKRTSMISLGRRLPWFRRFTLPVPDGTIGDADKQQLVHMYSGIAAAEPSASSGSANMMMLGVG